MIAILVIAALLVGSEFTMAHLEDARTTQLCARMTPAQQEQRYMTRDCARRTHTTEHSK